MSSVRKEKKLHIMLILFMAFSLMPDVVSINGHSIKPMYIIFALMLVHSIKNKKIYCPVNAIVYFFTYMTVLSVVLSFSWGVDRLFFNYGFGFVIVILFYTYGKNIEKKTWESVLQIVWFIFVIAIVYNCLTQGYRFIEYFEYKLDHPYITTLVIGGVNVEATWIAILALAFFSSKLRWLVLIFSIGMSLLYASRVGMIANMMVAFVFMYGRTEKDTKQRVLNRRIFFTVILIISFIVLIVCFDENNLLLQVFSRFKDIGRDPGSLGRFAMWKYFIPTVQKYPFGVGLGNVISAIETISPLDYAENNMHNIFLQMFCELGVVGGVWYIGLWFVFLIKECKKILNTPIVGMLFIYCFLGLFQFRGGETFFFCILGIYLSCTQRKMVQWKENEKCVV